jgi:thioredoxin 1
MIINIESKEQFEKEIQSGVVLVDFWAPWCGPCRMLAPNIEAVEQEKPNLKVLKVNVDEFEEIARKFGISAIPTVYIFANGEEVVHHVGLLSKSQIEDLIVKNIA